MDAQADCSTYFRHMAYGIRFLSCMPIIMFFAQVLYHWEECGLPVSSLEQFLTENHCHTACLLSTILFQ